MRFDEWEIYSNGRLGAWHERAVEEVRASDFVQRVMDSDMCDAPRLDLVFQWMGHSDNWYSMIDLRRKEWAPDQRLDTMRKRGLDMGRDADEHLAAVFATDVIPSHFESIYGQVGRVDPTVVIAGVDYKHDFVIASFHLEIGENKQVRMEEHPFQTLRGGAPVLREPGLEPFCKLDEWERDDPCFYDDFPFLLSALSYLLDTCRWARSKPKYDLPDESMANVHASDLPNEEDLAELSIEDLGELDFSAKHLESLSLDGET